MKYIYLGPNRPFGLPLMRNAILADNPENVFPQAREHFQKSQAFRKLFIPVEPASGLAQARKAVATPGTPLNDYFSQVVLASATGKE